MKRLGMVSRLLGLSLALLLPAALACGPSPVLRVVADGGEVILRVAIPELRWELHWRHSVSGVWLRDLFAWRDGAVVLTDAYAPNLDLAGMGHTPGRGELRFSPEGGYHIANIGEVISGVYFRLGSSLAPTVLVVQGRRYQLSELYPGGRVRFEVPAFPVIAP
jgi:hypothetical protein